MSERDLIVVDVETTGLDPKYHVVLEVAAINVRTGEELHFAPRVSPGAWEFARGDALRINRYYERGVYALVPNGDQNEDNWGALEDMLSGNTVGGSNPAFDTQMLTATRPIMGTPWHHRLADLSAYAAPALGLEPTGLVGLAAVCAALGVTNEASHTALGDARATAECFRKLSNVYRDKGAVL